LSGAGCDWGDFARGDREQKALTQRTQARIKAFHTKGTKVSRRDTKETAIEGIATVVNPPVQNQSQGPSTRDTKSASLARDDSENHLPSQKNPKVADVVAGGAGHDGIGEAIEKQIGIEAGEGYGGIETE